MSHDPPGARPQAVSAPSAQTSGATTATTTAPPSQSTAALKQSLTGRAFDEQVAALAPAAPGAQSGAVGTYAPTGASRVYKAGGLDIMVFLPRQGLKGPSVDVSMFFHGNGANYEDKTDEDNSVRSSRMAEAVADSGKNVVGLAPFAGKKAAWQDLAAGKFQQMIDGVLQSLSKDLGASPALEAGAVSLVAHSGGGRAVGQAALDTGASEVTLQDAGYGKFDGEISASYGSGWDKLGRWFLTGKGPKTLRVLTAWPKGTGDMSGSTRYVIENKTVGFSQAALATQIDKLVASGQLTDKPSIATEGGEKKSVRSGGMTLESKLTATNADGTTQGTLYVYSMAAKHGEVRDRSMAAAVKGGGDDFGKPELGAYEVTDKQAYVRDDKQLATTKKVGGKAVSIPFGERVEVTALERSGDDVFARVARHGWTKLSNLTRVKPKP